METILFGRGPGVKYDMVLDIFHIYTSINDLPLCDCHSVVVHLIESEVSICMKSLNSQALNLNNWTKRANL